MYTDEKGDIKGREKRRHSKLEEREGTKWKRQEADFPLFFARHLAACVVLPSIYPVRRQ